MTERFFIGIDPGKNGAIAMVDADGKIISLHVMPKFADKVDARGLFRLLNQMTKDKDVLVHLEKAQAFPKQGVVSVLNYGIFAGYCEMALYGLALPFELVTPQAWQKVMHSGIETSIKDAKIRSALKVQRLMGLEPFMIGKKTKRPHDGLVDAYLIALHAQRQSVKKKS